MEAVLDREEGTAMDATYARSRRHQRRRRPRRAPRFIVMASNDDESSGGDPIASYALPDGDSPAGVLAANGVRAVTALG